jgi:uncharacterized protein YycO
MRIFPSFKILLSIAILCILIAPCTAYVIPDFEATPLSGEAPLTVTFTDKSYISPGDTISFSYIHWVCTDPGMIYSEGGFPMSSGTSSWTFFPCNFSIEYHVQTPTMYDWSITKPNLISVQGHTTTAYFDKEEYNDISSIATISVHQPDWYCSPSFFTEAGCRIHASNDLIGGEYWDGPVGLRMIVPNSYTYTGTIGFTTDYNDAWESGRILVIPNNPGELTVTCGSNDVVGTAQYLFKTPPPVAAFKSYSEVEGEKYEENVLPKPHMVGGKILFSPEGTIGEIVKYEWDFGNGIKIVTDQPNEYEMVYTEPENFKVNLTVTDKSGLSNSTYETIDLTLQPGDLIFLRSGFPWNVPFNFIKNNYTHVGMYVGKIKGTHYMIEATNTPPMFSKKAGVQLTTFPRWNASYETYADLVRIDTSDIADSDVKNKAIAWAMSKLGQNYDLYSIGAYTKQLDETEVPIKKTSIDCRPLLAIPYVGSSQYKQCVQSPNHYYCSELVWAAYYRASDGQIDLSAAYGDGAIPPDGIIKASQRAQVIASHHEHYPA